MRDDLKQFSVGFVLLAALVAGLLYWSRRDAKPRAPLATREEEIAAPVAPSAPRAAAPVKLAEVAKPVTAAPAPARAALPGAPIKIASASPAAERIPFPSNLPTAFTEAGFQREMERVIAECKFPYEISEVDCTEFPCIAWGKWKDRKISPDECASWHHTFGSYDFIFFHNDASGAPLAGIGVFPPDYAIGGSAVKHLQQRASGMVQAQGGEKLFDDPASDSADSDSSNKPQQRAPKEERAQKQQLAKAG